MAKINVTGSTFSHIVVSYLLDKILHLEDVSPYNKEFTELMTKFKGKGLLQLIRHYYLDMDNIYRVRYKLIKDAFSADANRNYLINIVPDAFGPPPEEDPGIVKRVIKKALKLIKSSNEFSDKEFELLQEFLSEEDNNNE